MKRIFFFLMILTLLLSGCKQALPEPDGVTDVFFAGDSGHEEPDNIKDLDLDTVDPIPDVTVVEPDEDSVVWYALIRQVDETGFLANQQTNPDFGLFECWPGENTRWLDAAGLQDLQMGDVVAITFDGCVDESYPAGLHRPDSIQKMSNSLETYLEQERLRLEKNTVHVYDFRVILKEYPLWNYEEANSVMLMKDIDFSAVSPSNVYEEKTVDNPDEDGGSTYHRILYIDKKETSVNDALGIVKELMGLPEVLQAWAVPCAT